jgi:acetyltransferase-like isoleucine patch superfamily enzyme
MNKEKSSFHSFIEEKERSVLAKYQDIVVGNRSKISLIRQELLTQGLTFISGAPGLFLRQKLYPVLFQSMGRGVVLGVGVTLRQPGKISLGRQCIIDDYVNLGVRGESDAGIDIRENTFIGRGCEIKARDGFISIDSLSSIGAGCRITVVEGNVSIGQNVLFGAYCHVGTGNHRFDRTDIPMAQQAFASKGGVIINDDVWVGANSVILNGVKIGKGAVIGACSFVNKDVPDYAVVFGAPAKVHRYRQ